VTATGDFTVTGAEGGDSGSQVVATFLDAGPTRPVTDYAATIDWGDSTSSLGLITFSQGVFTITSSHQYAEEGHFSVTVSIARATIPVATADSQAVVTDPAVTPVGGLTLTATEGSDSGSQTLATFTDPADAEDPNNYSATVDWGDNNTSTGAISFQTGTFTVSGNHTYGKEGSYPIRVTVQHDQATDVVAIDSAVVAAVPPTLTIRGNSSVAEGDPYVLNLSRLYVGDPDGDAITGWTITWGDGNTQTMDGNPAQVTHVYAEGGQTHTISATATDEDGVYAANSLTVTVSEVPPTISASGATSVTEGSSYVLTLGQITDPGQDDHITQIIVHWGDGNSDTFTTTGDKTHSYGLTVAPATTTVDVVDEDGTHLNAGNPLQVTINDAPLDVQSAGPLHAIEGLSMPDVILATFTDQAGAQTVDTYHASIDWGDGVSTVGRIKANGRGGFDVIGSHTYAEEGARPFLVTITDIGGSKIVAHGTVEVADANLTATGTAVATLAGAPLTAVVATFSDANQAGAAGEFTATIDWGDGRTSAGVVAASDGHFNVTGQHVYGQTGAFPITVLIADAGGSTARASGTANVTLSPTTVPRHQAQSIAFWHSRQGQSLIRSFNGGVGATALANWLAHTFPNLYGNVSGWTNTQVAALFQTLSNRPGPRLEAELLATALNVYASTRSLGGPAGSASGFAVSDTGLGASTYDVGVSGTALQLANDHRYSVFTLLLQADHFARLGSFRPSDSAARQRVYSIFHGINTSWTTAIESGQAASIDFWNSPRGQGLILSFNGGPGSTALASWLARTFPNLYGTLAGWLGRTSPKWAGALAHAFPDLYGNVSGWTNAQIATLFQTLCRRPGPRLEAEMLATALNVYASTRSLGGLAGSASGFAVSDTGLGASTYDVGVSGTALRLADDRRYAVLTLLRQANRLANEGVLADRDLVGRQMIWSVFHGVNMSGGVP
jgi:hypothetical protein